MLQHSTALIYLQQLKACSEEENGAPQAARPVLRDTDLCHSKTNVRQTERESVTERAYLDAG